jgi:hypothetical protein
MGFANNPPPRQRLPRSIQPRSIQAPGPAQPDVALAGVVAMELLLARTPETAVAVSRISAYPQGFRVLFSAVSRQAVLPEEPPQLDIRYACGRRAYRTLESATIGPLRYDMACWVWPLPPPGPVVFACRWPAGAVPESAAAIDAGLILDAASRAVELWPE